MEQHGRLLPFDPSDVDRMVKLVASAGDPTADIPLPDRKRLLLEGVAELVGADVWIWSTAAVDLNVRGNIMTTCLIDGGWRNDQERAAFYEALTDPAVGNVMQRGMSDYAIKEQYITGPRSTYVSEADWEVVRSTWIGKTGFCHYLISLYPISREITSGIGLHRRAQKPPFTDRERGIVHAIFQQVDWLHRHGTNVPAGRKVLRLSPREKQVLIMLMGGDSRDTIASKLDLSPYTVGDYLKAIYKHFQVTTRAELLAFFLSGGVAK